MPSLAIIFSSTRTKTLIHSFLDMQYNILFGADMSVTKNADLTLFLTETTEFSSLPQSPWLVWDQTGDPQAISKAYQAGARAVFPKETSPNVILETIQRTMGELLENRKDAKPRTQRTYRRGELILLEADAVLHVEDGILATTMIHQDGVEVLLGHRAICSFFLFCYFFMLFIRPLAEIYKYTDLIKPYPNIAGNPNFSVQLCKR